MRNVKECVVVGDLVPVVREVMTILVERTSGPVDGLRALGLAMRSIVAAGAPWEGRTEREVVDMLVEAVFRLKDPHVGITPMRGSEPDGLDRLAAESSVACRGGDKPS